MPPRNQQPQAFPNSTLSETPLTFQKLHANLRDYNPDIPYQAHKDTVLARYVREPYSDRWVQRQIRKELPDFSLSSADTDPVLRSARAELSRKARDTQLDLLLHEKEFFARSDKAARKAADPDVSAKGVSQEAPKPAYTLPRPWCNFVIYSDSEEATRFNDRLMEVSKSNDPQVRGSFVYGELDRLREVLGINTPEDVQRLSELDDTALVDKYPDIYRLLRLAGELESLKPSNGFDVTPEQQEFLKTLQGPLMNLHYNTTLRMNIIANPYYEILDADYFYNRPISNLHTSITDRTFPQRDNPEASPLHTFFMEINTLNEYRGNTFLERISAPDHPLRDSVLGLPQSADPRSAIAMFRPLAARTADGESKVVLSGAPEKLLDTADYMKDLSALATKVDKWLLTGSREFANMQRALSALQTYCAENPDAGMAELAAETEKLRAAAETYLRYKGIEEPDQPASFSEFGKNRREQSRIDAASTIFDFAASQIDMMNKCIQRSAQNEMEEPKQELPQEQAPKPQSSGKKLVKAEPKFLTSEEVQQKAQESRDRVNQYLDGKLTLGTDMGGGKKFNTYRKMLPTDLQTIAFHEALTMGNSAMNGKCAYQTILDEQGYDAAFKQFCSASKQNSAFAKLGLTDLNAETVSAFMNNDGPKKMALNTLQHDPQQEKPKNPDDLDKAIVMKPKEPKEPQAPQGPGMSGG